MSKLSIVAMFGLTMAVMGCSTTSDSSQISVDTVQSTVDLRPVAPGVSQGVYDQQQVLYVNSKQGADWLFNSTLNEYNELLSRYALTSDASLQPRLNQLQELLQAASDHPDSSFIVTSIPEDPSVVPVSGPSCSGGGSTCNCAPGCFCVSGDNGCGCNGCPITSTSN